MSQELIENWLEIVEMEAVVKERKAELREQILAAAEFKGKTGRVKGEKFTLKVTKTENIKYEKEKLLALVLEHEELLPLYRIDLEERSGDFQKYISGEGEYANELQAIRTATSGSPKIEIESAK